jgi:hypothetical protein
LNRCSPARHATTAVRMFGHSSTHEAPGDRGLARMKFVADGAFTDPDAGARKLVEIANATEAVQDGRLYIELINDAFLPAGGSPAEFRAGIERALEKGGSGGMKAEPV